MMDRRFIQLFPIQRSRLDIFIFDSAILRLYLKRFPIAQTHLDGSKHRTSNRVDR